MMPTPTLLNAKPSAAYDAEHIATPNPASKRPKRRRCARAESSTRGGLIAAARMSSPPKPNPKRARVDVKIRVPPKPLPPLPLPPLTIPPPQPIPDDADLQVAVRAFLGANHPCLAAFPLLVRDAPEPRWPPNAAHVPAGADATPQLKWMWHLRAEATVEVLRRLSSRKEDDGAYPAWAMSRVKIPETLDWRHLVARIVDAAREGKPL